MKIKSVFEPTKPLHIFVKWEGNFSQYVIKEFLKSHFQKQVQGMERAEFERRNVNCLI